MPVKIVHLSNKFAMSEDKMTSEQSGLLSSCLEKIEHSQCVSSLASSEVYKDNYLRANGLELRLCTVHISQQARLFYTTYQSIFIPLDVCWNHKLDDFHLVKDQNKRNELAQEIIQKMSVLEVEEITPINKLISTSLHENRSFWHSKKTSPKKSIIQLTEYQEPIVTNSSKAQINLCFGPPGTGKTEVAKAVINLLPQGLRARYFTLGSRLCSQVSQELLESPGDFRCDTWDNLCASLKETFIEIDKRLTEVCLTARESRIHNAEGTKKSKNKSTLIPLVKTEPEILFDDLANIMKSLSLHAADFTDFKTWYTRNKQMKYSQDRNLSLSNFDAYLLFAEFTRIIIHQGDDLTRAYLKIDEYLLLGDGQSYIPKKSDSKRRFAYECFEKYLSALGGANLCEPHILMHGIFQFIQKINHPNMVATLTPMRAFENDDDQQESAPDYFSNLRTDILVLDEAQQMPIWLLHILMELKPSGVYLFADPHQIMGPQATRVIEPLKKALSTHLKTEKTYFLNKNFRNAKLIGSVANILLNFERSIYGSNEKRAEFFLDCEHAEYQGLIDCKADDENTSRTEQGDHNTVIIVPDQFEITDNFRARWGNNVLHISEIGGLEWSSVTMVGFSKCYKNELKVLDSLQSSYPLLAPNENTTVARKKDHLEIDHLLASRDALHRLYTVTTRAKQALHFVDDHPFLKKLITVAFPGTAATESVNQDPARKKSTPLDWIAVARQYFEEETSYETAESILWGNEIWSSALLPEIKEFLSDLKDRISTCDVMQTLFEMPELQRKSWFEKIVCHSNSGSRKQMVIAIQDNRSVEEFNNYEKRLAQTVLALEEQKAKPELLNFQEKTTTIVNSNLMAAEAALKSQVPAKNGQEINDQLYNAIQNGRLKEVKNCLADGANINCIFANGSTPLCMAVRKNDRNIVEHLLSQQNIDVNSAGTRDYTPLMIACNSGYLAIVKKLLGRSDLDVNSDGNRGAPPFYMAATKGHLDIIKELLKRRDLKYQNSAYTGDTPLMIAANQGHLAVVQHLITLEGVHAGQQNKYRKSALHSAAEKGQYDIVRLLIEKGAPINVPDHLCITPLYYAIEYDHLKVVEVLLEYPETEINETYSVLPTPLCRALEKKHISIAWALLNKGADVNKKLACGHAPIYWAVNSGNTKIVKALLEKGAHLGDSKDFFLLPLMNLALDLGLEEIADVIEKFCDTLYPQDIDSPSRFKRLIANN